MQTEIEAKFLNVDHDEIREKLKSLGAELKQPMRMMRRAVMDYPDERLRNRPNVWGWIRVRDEGDKVTVTYKQVAKNDSEKLTHEIEYVVSSYEQAVSLFEEIGLIVFSEQETKREVWELDGVEIMLDEWPWLPSFIEIEGKSTKELKSIAERLMLNWDDKVLGSSDTVYRLHYPGMSEAETVGYIPKLSFDQLPEWLQSRK